MRGDDNDDDDDDDGGGGNDGGDGDGGCSSESGLLPSLTWDVVCNSSAASHQQQSLENHDHGDFYKYSTILSTSLCLLGE